MLVLSRKVGEKISIGPSVTVLVLGVVGKKVKLGVVAPEDIPVHRQEVKDKIDKEMEDHFTGTNEVV